MRGGGWGPARPRSRGRPRPRGRARRARVGILSLVTAAHPERVPAPPLQRDGERGVLGGVCAGLARRLGIEPLPNRIVARGLALAGGLGVPVYLLGWAAMPGDGSARGLGRAGRSAVEVALGVGLLAISAMLAVRGMGVWISDAVAWQLALVAG